MSLNIEGCSCARCKAYLFSEDDVVFCPECGAPHHRDCYNALGHCALESLHGTPEEYSLEKELESKRILAEKSRQAEESTEKEDNQDVLKTCSMCGEKYERSYNRCPKCSAPDMSRFAGFEAFDFLGGVPADYRLDENVTANDAKLFVATNTHRYIPKFASLNKKNKLSWNWMAFLFPCAWMLSRKMYKGGIVAGALSVITTLCSYPMTLALYNLGITNTGSYPEMMSRFSDAIPQIGMGVIACALIGFFIGLIIKLIFGLFSDYFYRDYTINQIKKIKSQSEDIEFDYRKKGGANLFLFFLGFLIVEYLPSFIVMLF